MYNNFISRNDLKNSNFEDSKFSKTFNSPNVFLDHKNFRDAYRSVDLIQNIIHKETEIFKTFRKNLGKNFLDAKPASLILFEKRLKQYFISSKFLDSFTTKKSVNLDEKINMGTLEFYNLSDKKFKNDVMNSVNREKILTMSRNFSLAPSKDIIRQEFYKKKYYEKNVKRIAKILKKKIKNFEANLSGNNFYENNNNDEKYEETPLELNKYFLKKRRKSQDITNMYNEKNKHVSFDKNININTIRKLIKHNSFTNKNREDSIEFQIYEYAKKDKAENKINYWLDTSNINQNNNENNKIMSKIFSKKNKINNLSGYYTTRRKKFINSRNDDINLYIKKYYTNMNRTESNTKRKQKNLFFLNVQEIKKLSKKYKIGINNNVNELNDYNKICKSKLLRILNQNNFSKKIYIMKKEKEVELNELKDLLFNDKASGKHKENDKNDSNKQNLNENPDKKSKTLDLKSVKKFMDLNGGKINKKTINLELKEIINNSQENLRKRIAISKIRKKCKENYRTIIKLRENLKYKKERLFEEFQKLETK